MATETALQVLSERVSNALDDLKEMKGQLTAVNQSLIVVAAIQERIATVDKKADDVAAKVEGVGLRVSALEGQSRTAALMWKIVGSLVLLALGGSGWWLSQLKDYYNLFPRVSAIEERQK